VHLGGFIIGTLKGSPEQSEILSCDTLVANERFVIIHAKDLCLQRSKQVAFRRHCYGTVRAAASVTGHTWNAELHHALRNITDN